MSGRVLLVDDSVTNRIVLKARLARGFYEVEQAETGDAALRATRRGMPDVIVIGAGPDSPPDRHRIALIEALRADPIGRSIPIVLVVRPQDRDDALAGLAAGADDVLRDPVDAAGLLARVRNLMREKAKRDELALRAQTCAALGLAEEAAAAPIAEAPARIEVISNDPRACHGLRRMLQSHLSARIECLSPRRKLVPRPAEAMPDLVILVPCANSTEDLQEILPNLRSRPAMRNAAILAVLRGQGDGPEGDAAATAILDLGANGCTTIEAGADEIALRARGLIRQKRANDRLRASVADGLRLAIVDPLTGLFNRRYAQHHLDRIASRAAETGGRYALMLLDIDRFKRINDQLGHAAGDHVLAEVAGRLRENLRSVDLLSRHGGEEFLAALPDTSEEEARVAAERLRRIVSDAPFLLPGLAPVTVTLSVGVAMGGSAGLSLTEVLAAADRALYESKHGGRNLVSFARDAA